MATHAVIVGLFFFGAMVVIGCVFVVAFVRQDLDYKRRKKRYEEERKRDAENFRREVDAILARTVARQKADQSPVSLPVTDAERQERRRVIRLYY